MRLLEDNAMNLSATARDAGVSHTTIKSYYKRFWEEYEDSKLKVGVSAGTIEATRLKSVAYLSDAMAKINNAFGLAVEEAIQILSDEEKRKKLPAKDLVQLINVLSPYVAEKKSIIGLKEPDTKRTQYNQFITNIMHKTKLNLKR